MVDVCDVARIVSSVVVVGKEGVWEEDNGGDRRRDGSRAWLIEIRFLPEDLS